MHTGDVPFDDGVDLTVLPTHLANCLRDVKACAIEIEGSHIAFTGGMLRRNHSWTYIGTRKRCGPCELRPQCTSSAFRGLVIHQNEPARQRARELANTPEFAKAQRQRKKVEALFAELKHQIGLRRLRLRRLKFVREQFLLAAAAQNIKRLVRFLSQPITPTMEAAT